MCTLAIYFQTHPEFPVVIAANRDEFYDRPALPPTRLLDEPWAVGGKDLTAGGTWLGVNAHHLVAGVLNRRSTAPPDATRWSRGQLCLDMLREPTVEAAAARICAEPGLRYNPFNLLLASPHAAAVIGNITGVMRAQPLNSGVHVITNLDLNDFECPRIARSYRLFEAAQQLLRPESLDEFRAELRRILSDHATELDPRAEGPPNNLCVHTARFGTRSSTLLISSALGGRFRMWHAAGPPCRTEYEEVPLP